MLTVIHDDVCFPEHERISTRSEHGLSQNLDSHSYPNWVKLYATIACAALMIVSSLISHPKWFHVFQPICGVSPRPFVAAYT